jgi:hypothetical protein
VTGIRHWYVVDFLLRKPSNKIQEWAYEAKRDQVKGTLLEVPGVCLGFQLTKRIQQGENFTDLSTKNIQPGVFLVLDYLSVLRYDIGCDRSKATSAYLVLIGESMFVVDETDLQAAMKCDTTNLPKETP